MNQDICRMHGFNIIFRDKDDYTQGFCKMCMKDNLNIIPESEVQEKLVIVISSLINYQEQFIDQTNQDFTIILNNLSLLIQDVKQLQINMIKESKKLLDIFKGFQSVDFTPIHQAITNFRIQIQFTKEKEQISKSLINTQQLIKTMDQQNNNQQIFDQILQDVQYKRKEKQQQLFKSEKQLNRLIIQPLDNYSTLIDKKYYCKSLAINSNGEILAVGYQRIIYIYEVHKVLGMLIEQQKKDAHVSNILCLQFMKQKDILISGGGKQDAEIKIWLINEDFKLQLMFQLQGHTDSIYCLQLNENEDIIISGSNDQTIKFWNKQQQWINQYTIKFESPILSLSLNQSENQLISAAKSRDVYVLKKSTYQQWEISYFIETTNSVLRLLFINDNEFLIQPKEVQEMELYKFNEEMQKFILASKINLKDNEKENNNNFEWLFPMKFIKNHSLLVNKNGRYVHYIQRQKNGQYTILKTLEFQSQYLYGTVTNDGQNLFTWDEQSSLIKLKKVIIQ